MTKHIVRIIVSVIIVAAIGYAAWVFFFKTPDDDLVYSDSLSVLQEAQEGDLQTQISLLSTRDYVGATSETYNGFDSENVQLATIAKIRAFLYGVTQDNYGYYYGVPYMEISDYTTASYSHFTEILNEAFGYYLPYAQFSTGVSADDIKAYQTAVSAYRDSYDDLLEVIESTITYQQSHNDMVTQSGATLSYNTTKLNILLDYYKQLLNKYTAYYGSYAGLIEMLQDYAETYSISDSFLYDIQAIYYNSAVYTVDYFAANANLGAVTFGTSLTQSVVELNQYLAQAANYINLYNNYVVEFETSNTLEQMQGAQSHFVIAVEVPDGGLEDLEPDLGDGEDVEETPSNELNFNFIQNYNLLNANYKDILFGANNIFTYSQTNKLAVAAGDSEASAAIREQYISAVSSILIYLGYGQEE